MCHSSTKFPACVIVVDLEVDFGDVVDIPEVIERPGEAVFDYAVKRAYPLHQLLTNQDQQVVEQEGR